MKWLKLIVILSKFFIVRSSEFESGMRMGLFRRKKPDDEGPSRIDRYRTWREARRERGFQKQMKQLEREEKMLPLIRKRAQLEAQRVQIARAKSQRRKYGGERFGGLAPLGRVGQKADVASKLIFGGEPARKYSGNPFESAIITPRPKRGVRYDIHGRPTKKRKRDKTIVIKMG